MLRKITVKDYMAENIVTLRPEMDVLEAIQKLLDNRITGAPVVDGHGNIIGTFSEMDCMKVVLSCVYHEDMGGKVAEFMNRNVEAVDRHTSIVEVAEKFSKTNIRNFPVTDEDAELVGVISRHDVLRALTAYKEAVR